MRASRIVTALLLTAFAAGVQAQTADATAKDKVAAAENKVAPVRAPAKPVPSLNHEGPFSVFTYEAIGATPSIKLGGAKAPAAQTDTVAAARK